ncbi:MAG: hypothetical protein ACK5HP_01730 [Bacilli bacterium]
MENKNKIDYTIIKYNQLSKEFETKRTYKKTLQKDLNYNDSIKKILEEKINNHENLIKNKNLKYSNASKFAQKLFKISSCITLSTIIGSSLLIGNSAIGTIFGSIIGISGTFATSSAIYHFKLKKIKDEFKKNIIYSSNVYRARDIKQIESFNYRITELLKKISLVESEINNLNIEIDKHKNIINNFEIEKTNKEKIYFEKQNKYIERLSNFIIKSGIDLSYFNNNPEDYKVNNAPIIGENNSKEIKVNNFEIIPILEQILQYNGIKLDNFIENDIDLTHRLIKVRKSR